jgi:hypothetical protein
MPKIKFPDDFDEKSERALKQLGRYAAACFWCGHGYKEYSAELEDEHFAYHCPDAPEELLEGARKRLMEGNADAPEKTARKATSKRRCRRKQP